MEGDSVGSPPLHSVVVMDESKLHEVIANGSLEFDEWISLISEVEKTYSDNIEKISFVFESFLAKFPLCYGYWRKYADHKILMCTVEKVVEVFENAVESVTYSVDLWVDYCTFGSLVFEDPSDVCRLFRRGISFVGKDYLCHVLWDKYINFEFSKKHWDSLANIYIQTLRFPTKKLHCYYDSFKKLVRIWEEEMEAYSNPTLEVSEDSVLDNQVPTYYKQEDVSCIIKDLLDQSAGLTRFKALQKYKSIGERFYKEASELKEKIDCIERCIKRSYFHVKPLDMSQLENWHRYLDFAELHGDFDWVVKLYERCLVPCACYPEFWMRYVECVESKGGREIANFALDRATKTFLKRVPVIHHFSARFKEQAGDVNNARAAFLQCDTELESAFVENVIMRANMEKRLGNFMEASNVYKEALELAAKMGKHHIPPILYVHFSRLKYATTDSEDAARNVLIDGIKIMPYCKFLIEELITFTMTHGGSGNINLVDSIVANAISPVSGASQALSANDGEVISRRYLELVDLYGTVHDVRNAWNRHVKLFPQSTRTTTYHSTPGTKQWKMVMEYNQETHSALPHQPSGGCSSDYEKLSLPENHDTSAAHPANGQVVGQKTPFLENHNLLSDQARGDLHQPGESEINMPESMHQAYHKDSKSPREGASEQVVCPDSIHQVSDENEGAQASLECSTANDVRQESDCEPEQYLVPPSLQRLSLDSQDPKSEGLVHLLTLDSKAPHEISMSLPTSLEGESPREGSLLNRSSLKSEAPQENSRFFGSMPNVDISLSSPRKTQAIISEQINIGDTNPSSPTSHQNNMVQALSRSHLPVNTGRNWHQRSHSDKNHRDSKFGFHGRSHRRLHQKRQVSPRRQYAQTETGPPIPQNQDLFTQSPHFQQGSQVQSQFTASTAHGNITAPQAWPTHNMQLQNLSSGCQSQSTVQPGTYPQVQMPSNEQQGKVQNSPAYNQMWQYYCYQQQQQFLWQQQQPQLHQYQQQLLQLQYLQQQQLQQQQLQQFQQQQQQQLPQQQQQQQLLQQPFQQQSLLCQHQQHKQQQLKLQQQQLYKQAPPPQQHGEQGQSERQINASPIQVQVAPLHREETCAILEVAASSDPQEHCRQSQ